MRLTRACAVLALAFAAVDCGDSNGPTGGHSTTIQVKDDFFTPSPDTVPVGQVTFSWNGSNTHDVRWDTGPNNPGNSAPMSSGTHQVTLQAGTYTYHCFFHGTVNSGMRGRIVVQ